jgi:hypothetical protein
MATPKNVGSTPTISSGRLINQYLPKSAKADRRLWMAVLPREIRDKTRIDIAIIIGRIKIVTLMSYGDAPIATASPTGHSLEGKAQAQYKCGSMAWHQAS